MVGKSSNAGVTHTVMGGVAIERHTLTGRTIGPGRQVGHVDISIGAWQAFPVMGGVANAGNAFAGRTLRPRMTGG